MRLRSLPLSSLLIAVPLFAACSAPPEDVGTTSEAVKVCPGPSTLQGVDVSHYDGTIDWAKVKGSGRDFAIMKATEGTTYVDPTFATNWAGSKANHVVRGAYHFFHSNMDPIVQADHFLSVMGTLEPGDLPPTLDLEVTDSQSASTIVSTATKWLDYVAAKTGVKPILYTGPSFVTSTLGSPAGFENHALLWIANWGVTCPDVPSPFTKWAFWQYADNGTVPGISSSTVDLDEFDGTLADLSAIAVQPSTSPTDAGADAANSDAGGSDAASSDAASSDAASSDAASSDAASSDGGAVGDAASSDGDLGGDAGAGATDGGGKVPLLSDTQSGGGCTTSRAGGGGSMAAAFALGAAVLGIARRRRAR